jgi:exoribonuclease R
VKALLDPDNRLTAGITRIREEIGLVAAFPQDTLDEAAAAAARAPDAHRDRTAEPFVTLDPASSTDLDQAFCIEPAGADLLLHYAIADVGWFVRSGGAIEREAWKRGMTQYLPGDRVPLYPQVLSEKAASLLPDGPRPAVVFSVRIDPAGQTTIDQIERAVIRSRAKLGYETVRDSDLPPLFGELARRIRAAERERGAARVDPPQQELGRGEDGRFWLSLNPQSEAELDNAALSLAANLAVAKLFLAHRTGLFRVMEEPHGPAVAHLRASARARGIAWPRNESLRMLERRLDAGKSAELAFMLEIRKAGHGASYAPFAAGSPPWHSAMEAAYVHATAPLRRLADRYVIEAALALAQAGRVPEEIEQAFRALPPVMARAASIGGRIERATLDLAEAVLLQGREGETFRAVVTGLDERGARLQLLDIPVVTRVATDGLAENEQIEVALVAADPEKRETRFAVEHRPPPPPSAASPP